MWRRVRVRSDSTIADLHSILQPIMSWTDTHLHPFVIHGKDYGIYPSGGRGFPDNPPRGSLHDFQSRVPERFLYTYDFGDHEEHEVRLEKVLPINPKPQSPACLGSARAGPPQACGGPAGFLVLQDHVPLDSTRRRTGELWQELARPPSNPEEEEYEELRPLRD